MLKFMGCPTQTVCTVGALWVVITVGWATIKVAVDEVTLLHVPLTTHRYCPASVAAIVAMV